MNFANIPSPSDGVWNLGPLPLRAYALAIILGIVVAIWVGERRFVARGGRPGTVSDIAVWAIPFGLIGARAYHVATNPEFYFGDGKDPIQALYVWEGGLGIWGAIAFGALGAYLGCRFSRIRFTSYIDAVAPGVVLAQAIGRWGNYFNQELFGKPTERPWGLEIDLENRPQAYLEYSTFHPTFLYESLWCVGVAIVVVLADRRFKLGRGRVFALYVALYTAGRAWIEDLRIDEAHEFASYRLNVWVSIAVFVIAVAYFLIVGRLRPGREASIWRAGSEPDAEVSAGAAGESTGEEKAGVVAAGAAKDSDGDSDVDGDDPEDAEDSDAKDSDSDGDKDSDGDAAEDSEADAEEEKADEDQDDSDAASDTESADEAEGAGDDSHPDEPEADASDDVGPVADASEKSAESGAGDVDSDPEGADVDSQVDKPASEGGSATPKD